MSPSAAPAPPATAGTAVVLINLGTPDAPTPGAVRRYLAEFLSDRRVIDYPRWLWLPILYGAILTVRPRRSAAGYQQIWGERGSPLLALSRDLAAALQQAFTGENLRVELAMTYGTPSLRETFARLSTAGVRRVLLLPLFPQYSATSTAASFDAAFAALAGIRHVPALRTVADYHAQPEYIAALAASVRDYWREHGRAPRLLLSFHGIPERYVQLGDPYFAQCRATAAELAQALELGADDLMVSFQSRVGREQWLGPYTDATLSALPAQSVRHVQVLCPGFAVDCLETLEEIALRGREQFLHAGGERLDYIPALNASDAHVRALATLVRQNTQGWENPA
jgi:ferrochelatase